jgi:hypothetical protein
MLTEKNNTQAVFIHHVETFTAAVFGKATIDDILSDYAEDSIIVSSEGAFHGLTEIRAFFESQLKVTPSAMVEAFKITCQQIHDEVALMVWKTEPFIPFGVDMFVIRDGKIRQQTTAAYLPS